MVHIGTKCVSVKGNTMFLHDRINKKQLLGKNRMNLYPSCDSYSCFYPYV